MNALLSSILDTRDICFTNKVQAMEHRRGDSSENKWKKYLLVKQYKFIIFSNIGNEKYFCTNKALAMECKRGDNSIIKKKNKKS